jgi:hypothetical protein
LVFHAQLKKNVSRQKKDRSENRTAVPEERGFHVARFLRFQDVFYYRVETSGNEGPVFWKRVGNKAVISLGKDENTLETNFGNEDLF